MYRNTMLFDLRHRHLLRLNFVELFLFQRGEKAIHPGVIVAASYPSRKLIKLSYGKACETHPLRCETFNLGI